jgi:hypothetical protein
MTRIFTPAVLGLLLALLLPACATTHRDVAVIALCFAGIAVDVAISASSGASGAPGGLLGLFVCEAGEAAITVQSFGEAAPPQPAAREESTR